MFFVGTLLKKFSATMKNIPNGNIGVSVSGGGDSLALLYLTADWAAQNGRNLKVVTIDHRLRPKSQSECNYVMKHSNILSVEHTTIPWCGKPSGNLQKSARDARHRLLWQWANSKNIAVVLLGHTLEDNAETIIMRLSRGSGIDGLIGIAQKKSINSLALFRPLLDISREDLREYLRYKNVRWIDDPSNFDDRFQRVRIRKLLPEIAKVGLTARKLTSFADHMSRAKLALDSEVLNFAKNNVIQRCWGDLEIEQEPFIDLAKEYQLRLLSASLRWVSGNDYRPRFKSLKHVLKRVLGSCDLKGVSLMGCILKCKNGKIVLTREFSATPLRQRVSGPVFVWDKKWNINVESDQSNFLEVGPLGKDGLSQIKHENLRGVPVAALQSSIALFGDNKVQCVPVISYGYGLRSELIGGDYSFFNFLSTY